MTAAELLPTLQSAGIALSVTEQGALRYQGDESAVSHWLPEIRANKPALVELLTQAANESRAPYIPPPPASASRTELEAWMDAVGETDTVTRNEVLANYGFEVQP